MTTEERDFIKKFPWLPRVVSNKVVIYPYQIKDIRFVNVPAVDVNGASIITEAAIVTCHVPTGRQIEYSGYEEAYGEMFTEYQKEIRELVLYDVRLDRYTGRDDMDGTPVFENDKIYDHATCRMYEVFYDQNEHVWKQRSPYGNVTSFCPSECVLSL